MQRHLQVQHQRFGRLGVDQRLPGGSSACIGCMMKSKIWLMKRHAIRKPTTIATSA